MTIVACHTCGVYAYDNNVQLSLSKINVQDKTCSYFVQPDEYAIRCQFVRGPHLGYFSAMDESCPHMRQTITERPDWGLDASAS
jgi:hypothetical protein